AAIFQRLSFSLTTYHSPPPAAGEVPGSGSTSAVTGTAFAVLAADLALPGFDSPSLAEATFTAPGMRYLRPSMITSGFFCSDGLALTIASRLAFEFAPIIFDAM